MPYLFCRIVYLRRPLSRVIINLKCFMRVAQLKRNKENFLNWAQINNIQMGLNYFLNFKCALCTPLNTEYKCTSVSLLRLELRYLIAPLYLYNLHSISIGSDKGSFISITLVAIILKHLARKKVKSLSSSYGNHCCNKTNAWIINCGVSA